MPDHTIVHHGRWYTNDIYPHDTHDSGFHAGTWQSAIDRLAGNYSEEARWADPGDYKEAEVHSYAVPNSLIDTQVWADPMTSDESLKEMSVDKAPEEVTKNKVLPYKNEYEDPGSTSFFIHPSLVYSGRIKHLGHQLVAGLNIPDEDHEDDDQELTWYPESEKFDMKNVR